MAKRQGTNILLGYLDSNSTFQQFAYAKSCDYEITRDFQEVSSPTSSDAKEYIPVRYSWSMNVSCLLSDNNSTLFALFKNAEKITVCWKDDTDDINHHETYTGYAYIKTLKANAQIHAMGSYTISLLGTGELTIGDADAPNVTEQEADQ